MRRLTLIALAVGAIVLLAACSNSSGDLTGKVWQLTAITEKTPAYQGVVPAADQSKYTITFNTDGTFNAKADCNAVAGTYKTSGSNLTITLGPSTLVACPDGSFGDLFAHALGNAASYAIANDQLTITLKDGGTLTFAVGVAAPTNAAGSPAAASATPKPTAKPTASPTARPTTAPTAKPTTAPTASPAPSTGTGGTLTDRTWQLTAITEKVPAFQGVVPAAEQANYTIEFKTDGTFGARADCNQVAGTYTTTTAGGLTLTLGPSTLVACPDGSLSDLYVLGLSNAASYAIANDQLTITLADQGTLVYK